MGLRTPTVLTRAEREAALVKVVRQAREAGAGFGFRHFFRIVS